jgi:hypothetical protein
MITGQYECIVSNNRNSTGSHLSEPRAVFQAYCSLFGLFHRLVKVIALTLPRAVLPQSLCHGFPFQQPNMTRPFLYCNLFIMKHRYFNITATSKNYRNIITVQITVALSFLDFLCLHTVLSRLQDKVCLCMLSSVQVAFFLCSAFKIYCYCLSVFLRCLLLLFMVLYNCQHVHILYSTLVTCSFVNIDFPLSKILLHYNNYT